MYKVYTYVENFDTIDIGHWRLRGKRKTPRGAVKLIRKMRAEGYDDDVSIYVEKVGEL